MHKTHDCFDLKKYVFFILTHENCTGKYTTKIYRAVHQCDMPSEYTQSMLRVFVIYCTRYYKTLL